ncbi:hypothetical protein SRHO_G00184860 [Serrasalmus rhombeus]
MLWLNLAGNALSRSFSSFSAFHWLLWEDVTITQTPSNGTFSHPPYGVERRRPARRTSHCARLRFKPPHTGPFHAVNPDEFTSLRVSE